jgi:hypothetical protein
MKRALPLLLIVAAVVATVFGLAFALRSAAQSKGSASPTRVEVTAPQHVQISDATAPPSVPPRPQVCLTRTALDGIIHQEMSPSQKSTGTILCQDGWLYSDVTGYDLGNGQVSDQTRILLFYVDDSPGRWVVIIKAGTDKRPADDPDCVRPIPDKIKQQICY